MKNHIDKQLSRFPIESWPIIGALAFSSNFSSALQNELIQSESFKFQMRDFAQDKELSDFLQIARDIHLTDLKVVERIFEGSLDSDVKKVQGVVYTPDFIIDFILDETVTKKNLPTIENPILDPACGSGGFLVRAARKLTQLTGADFADCTELLCGADINPKAIANAKLLLDMACLSESGKLSKARFLVCDSLLLPIEDQLSNLGINGGVSALVTNPPYVKLQNLDRSYSNELLSKFPIVASGAFSLASLFLYNSVRYLSSNGKAGLITLNNVFTSLSGKNLRQTWSRERQIRKIVDFRHYTVFDASAYTCLIFLGTTSRRSFNYNAVGEMPTYENLKSLKASKIRYDSLRDDKWRLGDTSSLKLISAMENTGQPLKSIAEIKVGFATLRDKVFTGIFLNGKPSFVGGDGVTREVEIESVMNYYKVSEFSEVKNLLSSLRPIIYPYARDKQTRPLIKLEEFAKVNPIAFEHLCTWKEELQSRGYGESDQWHEWGRRQSLMANGPKLLTKTFDLRPNFRLDSSDSLFCNGYSVKPKEILDSYDVSQLKLFLESRFVHAYALITSFEIAGGYQCYQKNFIENICLPPSSLIDQGKTSPEGFERIICDFYEIEVTDLDHILAHYGS